MLSFRSCTSVDMEFRCGKSDILDGGKSDVLAEGSSSSVLKREGGLSDMRDGVLTGLRAKPLGLGPVLAGPDGVRSPLRPNLDGVAFCGDL